MWIIYVTPPPPGSPKWDFRRGFFPRKVRSLSMAKELVVDARRRGGMDIRIEREIKRQQDPEGRVYQAGYAHASGYSE